jgi:hypothetical protein
VCRVALCFGAVCVMGFHAGVGVYDDTYPKLFSLFAPLDFLVLNFGIVGMFSYYLTCMHES